MKIEDAFALGSGFGWEIAMEHDGEELEVFLRKLSGRIDQYLEEHPLEAAAHAVVKRNKVDKHFYDGLNQALMKIQESALRHGGKIIYRGER